MMTPASLAPLIFPVGLAVWLFVLWLEHRWNHRMSKSLRLDQKIRRLTVRTETQVAKLRAKQTLIKEIEEIRGRD